MILNYVVISVVVGVFLIIVTDSVVRQRDRIWGRRQKARIERARGLAGDPAAMAIWAITQALIVGSTGLLGLLLILMPMSIAVFDSVRGVPVSGFTEFMLGLMILVGVPIVYLALRAASQIIGMLESIGPSTPKSPESD